MPIRWGLLGEEFLAGVCGVLGSAAVAAASMNSVSAVLSPGGEEHQEQQRVFREGLQVRRNGARPGQRAQEAAEGGAGAAGLRRRGHRAGRESPPPHPVVRWALSKSAHFPTIDYSR